MRERTSECARCGARFDWIQVRKPRKYCDSCRWIRAVPTPKQCEGCGAVFLGERSTKRYCSRACNANVRNATRADGVPTQCGYCGIAFTPKFARSPGKYCSRRCNLMVNHSGKSSAWPRPTQLTVVPWAACLHCREWFVASTGRKQHTSACRHQLTYVSPVPAPRPCRVCGVVGPPIMRQGGYTCTPCGAASRAASSRENKGRRRARKRGAPCERFTRQEIFERDDWTCYLCGRLALGEWNDPDEPTIDHIQPLAKGGAHTRINVACCCRRCNSLKIDFTFDEYRARVLDTKGT